MDGFAGKRTKETLKAFGRARRLSLNSDHIDEQLVATIEQAAAAEQDAPATGPTGWKYPGLVCRAQAGLNALGYPAGPRDGIAGRQTKGALEAFGRDQRKIIIVDHIDEQLVATIEQAADKLKPK
jgi:hypothetical protein